MKPAVLVIDMLNDFVEGSLKLPGAEGLVPNIKKLLEAARQRGVPIVYVCDAHLEKVDRQLELWGPHALRGTWGAKVVSGLEPLKGDFVVEKRRYSGFYETGLDLLLRELGVDTLILTGVATEVCVQHTAADAYYRGYRLVVVEDCVKGVSEEAHRAGLEAMKRLYGAKVVKLSEALSFLAPSRS
ncbi:MAG: cysteine hydrolase [Candidatus Nezhaarchaeota archaeon]|nr:cysteine hydrolase [Candidatus Nezhaarchaeota archaeon]